MKILTKGKQFSSPGKIIETQGMARISSGLCRSYPGDTMGKGWDCSYRLKLSNISFEVIPFTWKVFPHTLMKGCGVWAALMVAHPVVVLSPQTFSANFVSQPSTQ